MPLSYIRQDLLRVRPSQGVVVNQINAVAQIGGLTKALCSKFPDNATLIESAYAEKQAAGDIFTMGGVLILDGRQITLCNIIAQIYPGHAGMTPADSYSARRSALQKGLDYVIECFPGETLYVPYMLACGQSGDSWDGAIEPMLRSLPCEVRVCVPMWAELAAEQAGRLELIAPPQSSTLEVDDVNAPLRSYVLKPLAS